MSTEALEPRLDCDDQRMIEAQEMTGWFMEVFMGCEPGENIYLPPLAATRLVAHIGGTGIDQICKTADMLWRLPPDFQESAIYYFCGYPKESFGIITDHEIDEIELVIGKQFGTIEPPRGASVRRIGGAAVDKTAHAPISSSPRRPPRPTVYLGDADSNWQQRGVCAQTDPEIFFPEKGGSTRLAKKVCANCEVRQDCLAFALKNNERFGIWGGLSERQRRKLKDNDNNRDE